MAKRKKEKELMYIHSRCCNAHWELIYDTETGKYSLVCEKCSKPIGTVITVTGPQIENPKCEMCGDGECTH
jgi:hypothetical protein